MLSSEPPEGGEDVRPSDEDDLLELFEHAPCGYLSAAPDGRLLKVNHTLRAWLGAEPGHVVGRRFQDLLSIPSKIFYETHFAPLLRMQGSFDEVALDLVAPDGRVLCVLANARERRDAAGRLRFVRITVFNATDRRRYERDLLEARRSAEAASAQLRELTRTLESRVEAEVSSRLELEEALRQAQKMEAIGQLTGGVAHDFNNLLTVILGGLETIGRQLEGMRPDATIARIQRAAAMARKGAERATTLTARLLAFSRRQPLQPRPVDASRLVTGLADMLTRTLGETIALQTIAGAGLWPALVDPGELENTLVNLAINARDAMATGGRLTIETSNASLDEDYAAAVAEPLEPGQYVLIAVSDTGHGMDARTVQRAFEPFFTTKDVDKGTGLGLSQVYGFVRQSRGHVRIYSEPGHGTTIKIYLPRHCGSERVDTGPVTQAAGPALTGEETILVVEDHEELRAYSTAVLREFGYHVLVAPDARAGLALIERETDINLLFTDVVLPGGVDGQQLAREAQRRRPGLKVLFTTGYTRNAMMHDGRLDSQVDLISKPFTAHALGGRVRAVLDRTDTDRHGCPAPIGPPSSSLDGAGARPAGISPRSS